ncbi:uncharacterized protein LOC119386716 isoform X1 [Rhipicephalus sanguineus]|uniref:uncharacterized protein LOC119386716 isoform X1 n=2 Tax=Rhipicephalus sanguineus TaxID=34632 RepID=UPI0018954434|nr:uncharacterized protein LOC119386716 isoform X1 [Rhipicephalus sanguineus]
MSPRQKGRNYCCVVNCHNNHGNTKGSTPPVKFYRFPNRWYEKSRRQAWITAVRRKNADGSVWLPKAWTMICSRHFVGNCKNDSSLHPSYVPTVFPAAYKKRAPHAETAQRWRRRSVRAARSAQNSVEQAVPQGVAQDDPAMQDEENSVFLDVYDTLSNDLESLETPLAPTNNGDPQPSAGACATGRQAHPATQADAACQTEPGSQGNLIILLSATNGSEASTQVSHSKQCDKVTTTDGNWKKKCEFLGFETLNQNETALRDLCGVTMQVFSLLLNILPEPSYRSTDMTREDKFCLFLAKLKLGVSFNALAAIFGVSKSTSSCAFISTLDILSAALQEWVFVPPRAIIRQCLPQPFKENYPECTFIIDCTEVRAETPSKPDCQYILYSNYKGGYTLKVLVGIIPNGMIAFLSDTYGGRQTDSFITQDSDFFKHVQKGDVILSDKGFPRIRTDVEDKGGVIVMPPFNSGGGQLSQEDMDTTYKIASVRIHVERVIGRLKIYRILRNTVPITLVPHMDKVFRVCAALVNMQPLIIQKKE